MAGLRYKGHVYAGVASYGNANEVHYDNTDSGLTSTNVQDALDEVSTTIDNLEADDVTYDNATSGLTATNVQDAVDEIVGDIDGLITKMINAVERVDYRVLDRTQTRAYGEWGELAPITLTTGVYLALSQTTTDAGYTGRAYCEYTGESTVIISERDLMPPTMPTSFGNFQLVQLIKVTASSAVVTKRYWDTNATGSKHIWQIFRIF